MNQARPSSWFRFSLRTLLVVVTAVCCWLAWESSVVRGRQAALKAAASNPAFQITTAEQWAERQPPGYTGGPTPRVSLIRRWLGDKAVHDIVYYSEIGSYSEAERGRLARIFPEAQWEEREKLYEPCHPGCFPRGTLVLTTEGPRRIEKMQVGDFVTALGPSGEIYTAQVQSIFVTDNRLWSVRTEAGELLTTETQPLCLAADEFKPAGELLAGDKILRFVDGELRPANVLEVSRTGRIEQVINLVLGDRESFVAGGYLARSKPPAEPSTP